MVNIKEKKYFIIRIFEKIKVYNNFDESRYTINKFNENNMILSSN